MQEHTVTVMGVSRKLEEPFFVLATQNPIEQDGTYPLPEAQMDRFMFKLLVPDPSLDELMQIVDMTQKTMAEVAECVCNKEQILKMRETANLIPVATDVLKYAMTMTAATHPDGECATEATKKYIRVAPAPCRSGAHFRGKSPRAHQGQIQRFLFGHQRTGISRSASQNKTQLRGGCGQNFRRQYHQNDSRRGKQKLQNLEITFNKSFTELK